MRLVRSDGHSQYHAVPHGSSGYQPGRFGHCSGLSFRQTPLCPPCGQRIVELVEEDISIRKILTRKSLENALMVNLAIGGSTNIALHLPAIAHELELELPLSRFNDYSCIIPTCADLSNGPHGMIDLFVASGIPAVMKMLGENLHRDPLTVSGMSIGDIIDQAEVKNATVIPDKAHAFMPEGGTIALFGSLAPEGAVVKQSAVAEHMRVFTGTARSSTPRLMSWRPSVTKH